MHKNINSIDQEIWKIIISGHHRIKHNTAAIYHECFKYFHSYDTRPHIQHEMARNVLLHKVYNALVKKRGHRL